MKNHGKITKLLDTKRQLKIAAEARTSAQALDSDGRNFLDSEEGTIETVSLLERPNLWKPGLQRSIQRRRT